MRQIYLQKKIKSFSKNIWSNKKTHDLRLGHHPLGDKLTVGPRAEVSINGRIAGRGQKPYKLYKEPPPKCREAPPAKVTVYYKWDTNEGYKCQSNKYFPKATVERLQRETEITWIVFSLIEDVEKRVHLGELKLEAPEKMIQWLKRLRAEFGASFLWLVGLVYFTQVFHSLPPPSLRW